MRLKDGGSLVSQNGEKLGKIERVVIDPETKEVTHVVVREGIVFTHDKVVPITLLGATEEDRVFLREAVTDIESLPDFEETQYVPVSSEEAGYTVPEEPRAAATYARPIYWYPPFTATPQGYRSPTGPVRYRSSPRPLYIPKTTQQIPTGAVALEEGARVTSADGEHLGDLEQVLTDPQTDRATHLIVSSGIFLKERKLVPTNWIARVGEEEVHLSVLAQTVESLRDYEPPQR